MNTKTLRPAIAMIELIFAIVIMGIVMMSAPMLISTATESTYVSIQQEGINQAASRVNMIMGYSWDENNNLECIPSILHVSSGAAELDENGISARRIGIPVTSKRTFICISENNSSNEFDASTLGSDSADEDDIDDFAGDINLNFVDGATDAVDYLEKTSIKINTAVAYVSDTVAGGYSDGHTITYTPFTAGAATTNIKSVTVTLTSTTGLDELEKTIVLRAFSCNIGGYEFEKRLF